MEYQGERTFSAVVQDIIGNVQHMIRSEIRLAKTEVKEETAKAARAARLLTAGAVLGLYAIGFLLLTFVRALETVTAPWLSSLIVSVVVGVAAYISINAGRTRLKYVHKIPGKTIQTIKENVEWMKDQTK